MSDLIKKFLQKIQDEGIQSAIKKASNRLIYKYKYKQDYNIFQKRLFLSNKLNKEFNGVIRYGPFKGFKFVDKSWWGPTDRANMLLGLYEQEVLKSLQTTPKKYKTFIDLGAANGYYGIGVLVGGIFEKSYCYEISLDGQRTIEQNAKLNNVFDKVKIRGTANKDFYKDLDGNEIDQSVLFVDIEGGEFELFDKNIFKVFSQSIIYIELHDWFFVDGNEKLKKLEEDARNYFNIKKLTTTSRDLSVFEELNEMSDTDRWLICSEGRGRRMTWWKLEPF